MTIKDWNLLNAPEVPNVVVGLMSTKEEKQLHSKIALAEFLGQHAIALNVAENVYNKVLETDAVVLLVELLIEMLGGDTPVKLAYVIELLEIASSYRQVSSLGQVQYERATRIYEIIDSKFEVYLKMLNHPNLNVRVQIIHLLENMPKKRVQIASTILQYIKTNRIVEERETLAAYRMLYKSIRNNEYDTEYIKSEFLMVLAKSLKRKHTSKILLSRSACYLILLTGQQVSKNTVNILVNILRETNFRNPNEDLLLGGLWIEALLSLEINQTTQSLINIFEYQLDEYALIEIGAILLNLHFGDFDYNSLHILMSITSEGGILAHITFDQHRVPSLSVPREQITDSQKMILLKFIQKDLLWDIQSNLFELFELPTSRSELENLVTM